MATFTPTTEQQNALDLFTSGDSLKIEAGAGTGKTATLVLLAKSTTRRGQYIAFNKAIVDESKAKMPDTVRCNTAHSIAFREVGKNYARRLQSGRMTSFELADRIGADPIKTDAKTLSRTFVAGLVMRSVRLFCQSADREPGPEHVPYIDGLDPVREDGSRSYANNDALARAITPLMRKAWKDLSDPRGQLPFSHDIYLKLYQLSGPKIGADYILFDECQDANPVILDIVRQQRHAQVVWVGDSQQQIYGFTGAVNALAKIETKHTTFLTQSFRFGPAVADVANRVLGMIPDAKLRLTGTDTIASKVTAVPEPDVVLTRTNAEAVRTVLETIRQGRTVHLVGGGSEVTAFCKAAEKLQAGERVEHPELACFENWTEVEEYVATDELGGDLKLMVDLINEFGARTIIDALEAGAREADADLVVSTAHKSKGREWNRVKLGGDFPEDRAKAGPDELRLLYVAVTRAKLILDHTAVAILNELEDDRRFCSDCGADIDGNDPHGPGCPRGDEPESDPQPRGGQHETPATPDDDPAVIAARNAADNPKAKTTETTRINLTLPAAEALAMIVEDWALNADDLDMTPAFEEVVRKVRKAAERVAAALSQ